MRIVERLASKLRNTLETLRGSPVESDLSTYETVAAQAEGIDYHGEDDAVLVSAARALRASMAEEPDQGARDQQQARAARGIALAREASKRRLGLEPYPTQLVAAAALCAGKTVQLQSGEGKTLAAAIAASFCALRDGWVAVVTANDYLAHRDAEWMRPIYEGLGLSVASIASGDPPSRRREAYRADILYVTVRELGFDYLRDGLARSASDVVQREFRSAIVDEADFILIDEARVPLVIAGADADGCSIDAVAGADRLVGSFAPDLDYAIDRPDGRVSLTLRGEAKAEAFFGVGDLRAAGSSLFARIHAALEARCLLVRDVDYIVRDGRIELVDALTGRIAERRKMPWGVQAALEAKEGLEIGREGRIYGSIAVQHLMGLFPRISAMTATAVPAAGELSAAYGMGTVVVPPSRPSRRRDAPDAVFRDRNAKERAIVEEVAREHLRGRPVLVGTASVRESEALAAELGSIGVCCSLLNAKNDAEEAGLVADAGARGAVTISTNMAGRGTDIRLGGEPELIELGGLYVIGTNRHESRRFDDQLRGRAGRQGDPGLTRFFVSLEDPLFERYGVEAFLPERYRKREDERAGFAGATVGGPGGEIEDEVVRREISRAQSLAETRNADLRRSLRKFSLLLERERRYLRGIRDRALLARELPLAVEAAIGAGSGGGEMGGDGASLRSAVADSFIARLDAIWADHLALVEDIKEGLGLQRYGGKDPGIEFVRMTGEAFEDAMRGLEEAAIADCRALAEGNPAGAGDQVLPTVPSSTWTYAALEDIPPGFVLEDLFRAK